MTFSVRVLNGSAALSALNHSDSRHNVVPLKLSSSFASPSLQLLQKSSGAQSTVQKHSGIVRASIDETEGHRARGPVTDTEAEICAKLAESDPKETALQSKRVESSTIDRIEKQAKTSIDRLRHILYQLKTSAPKPASTTIHSRGLEGAEQVEGPGLAAEGARLADGDVYISQNFEVELGPSSQLGEQQSTDLEAESDSEDSEVAFVHHDSLTCTHTSVKIDEKAQMAVVTVTATVRGSDVAEQDKEGYTERSVALAARALARTSLALDEKAQAALHGGPAVADTLARPQERVHDSLLRVLEAGTVRSFCRASAGPDSSPFRELYDVKLEGEGGEVVDAVFKPAVPGDALLRWRRAPADWVAYQMNLLLGLDLVPPAIVRTNFQHGEEKWALGVMMYRVQGLQPLIAVQAKDWGVSSPSQLVAAAHVLDGLLGSAPRHSRQFQAGLHWLAQEQLQPVLTQHPLGPGNGELHSMWARRGDLRGVKGISDITLGRLRMLSQGLLLEQFGGALTIEELALILDRRDHIVAYFDTLAKRHGRAAVLA